MSTETKQKYRPGDKAQVTGNTAIKHAFKPGETVTIADAVKDGRGELYYQVTNGKVTQFLDESDLSPLQPLNP